MTELLQEPAVEVVFRRPVMVGGTAHRRTAAPRLLPGKENPSNPYDGAPTAPLPACGVTVLAALGAWAQVSAGRAHQLGLDPCHAAACFGGAL